MQGTRVQACTGCSVSFTATKVGGTPSQVVGPFAIKYDPATQQYIYNWKLTTTTSKWGLTNLTATVTYPGTTTPTTKTEQVTLS